MEKYSWYIKKTKRIKHVVFEKCASSCFEFIIGVKPLWWIWRGPYQCGMIEGDYKIHKDACIVVWKHNLLKNHGNARCFPVNKLDVGLSMPINN